MLVYVILGISLCLPDVAGTARARKPVNHVATVE